MTGTPWKENPALSLWLTWWETRKRYHRFEVEGLENLDLGRSALIVGYHGRPVAYDLCILSAEIYRTRGYMPHAVFHSAFASIPALKWLMEGLGGVTGDDPGLKQAIARGEHIMVLPGGTRESARSLRTRYQVDWGDRTGYLKFAIKHGLPIIPVGARGVDDAFLGLNNGYALGKRLGISGRVPLWLGLGLGGFWPLALPLPVKFSQRIGEPIWDTVEDGARDLSPEALKMLHEKVVKQVQALLEPTLKHAESQGGSVNPLEARPVQLRSGFEQGRSDH